MGRKLALSLEFSIWRIPDFNHGLRLWSFTCVAVVIVKVCRLARPICWYKVTSDRGYGKPVISNQKLCNWVGVYVLKSGPCCVPTYCYVSWLWRISVRNWLWISMKIHLIRSRALKFFRIMSYLPFSCDLRGPPWAPHCSSVSWCQSLKDHITQWLLLFNCAQLKFKPFRNDKIYGK